MIEQSILKRILFACSTGASRLFRQNTGMGWIGKSKKYHARRTVELHPGDVVIRKARPFHAGFVGMSDLIGWHSITVTPEMVGQRLAIYTAVEVKSKTGRPTKDQLRFIDMVRSAGGIAGIARSADEAMRMLSEFRK